MFSLISIFPLAVFYASFFNSAGGMAGDNLLSSAEAYLSKFWFGFLSISIFLFFQYIVFNDLIKLATIKEVKFVKNC